MAQDAASLEPDSGTATHPADAVADTLTPDLFAPQRLAVEVSDTDANASLSAASVDPAEVSAPLPATGASADVIELNVAGAAPVPGLFGPETTVAFDLATLNGSNGFTFLGEAAGDSAGDSESGAGDSNGDGCLDVVFVARYADVGGASTGAGYGIF